MIFWRTMPLKTRLTAFPRTQDIDLIYTDECKIDENDIVQQLMPKPDWSPLLLMAFMYTGHFSIYRTSIVRQAWGPTIPVRSFTGL